MPPIKERRKRSRFELHWPVFVCRNGRSEPIRSYTENISSGGFYALFQEPFLAGEQLDCVLSILSHTRPEAARLLVLECRVRVARVNIDRGLFGVGFQMESYSVLRLPPEATH